MFGISADFTAIHTVVYFTKFSVFQNISVHTITSVDGIATLYWLNG